MREKIIKVRKKPVQARSKTTVDAILEAAAQVLETRGYAKSTTNHIARRAGVSIGSLYQYFPNKEAIVYSLMEAHMVESASSLHALMTEVETRGHVTPGDIKRFVMLSVELHQKEPSVHRAIVQDIPFTGKVWWEAFQSMERVLVDRLQVLLNNTPEIRRGKSSTAARLVIRVLESLTHRQVLGMTDRLDQAEFIEETSDMICRYLFKVSPDSHAVAAKRPPDSIMQGSP